MSDDIRVITNYVARDIIDGISLPWEVRKDFDYIDWGAVDRGEHQPQFFSYKGTVYDLGEFMLTGGLPEFNPLRKWDGYISDTFFSGVVVKYVSDYEQVIVGRFVA